MLKLAKPPANFQSELCIQTPSAASVTSVLIYLGGAIVFSYAPSALPTGYKCRWSMLLPLSMIMSAILTRSSFQQSGTAQSQAKRFISMQPLLTYTVHEFKQTVIFIYHNEVIRWITENLDIFLYVDKHGFAWHEPPRSEVTDVELSSYTTEKLRKSNALPILHFVLMFLNKHYDSYITKWFNAHVLNIVTCRSFTK